MTVGYYGPEEDASVVDWNEIDANGDFWDGSGGPPRSSGFDGITIVAVALLLFLTVYIILDRTSEQPLLENIAPIQKSTQQTAPAEETVPLNPPIPAPAPVEPSTIVSPYDDYVLTQGLHGMSYGHMAIDIAAGKGVALKSPISGLVSDLFVDGIGNPVLVIENEIYRVTLLHGNYEVSAGQELTLGERVGTEGNRGYTVDWAGQLCAGRDCGYHTHLNVFDKRVGANVNPLNLIS